MKNNLIKVIFAMVFAIILSGCDAKRNALYEEISKLETEANFITLSLANNHREQLNLLKDVYDKGFFNQVSGGAFTTYYVGSIVKNFDSILFDEAKSIKPNKDYVANIIIHLKNLYEGNEPYKYAYITMYESVDWQLKIFRVLPSGAIVSLTDKCSGVECQTYYIYVEGLKGVDNQNFKQELVLEYKGSFSHNEPLIEITTLPSYKIVKKIQYSTPLLINKWIAYNETLKTFENEKEFAKIAKKNKKLTYEYLESKNKLIESAYYDMETSKKYLSLYASVVDSLYNYRKTRRDYYYSNHPALYKSLLKDSVFSDYPKLYKTNKAKIEELQQTYNSLVKRLAETKDRIAYLKEQSN